MATVETTGLVHDAFVYSSDQDFLAVALPFLEEGMALGQPTLAAPAAANAELLRANLGKKADRIDWLADGGEHRTAARLELLMNYIDRSLARGASRIRMLGEPAWPPHGGPGVDEWKRYESFLNVALAPFPVWLVCPYDGRRLSADILADACRTHPVVGFGFHRAASEKYVAPEDFAREVDAAPLSRPPADSAEAYFDDVTPARRFVELHAANAGLPPGRVKDSVLVAGELVTNVFLHASDVARVRTWCDGGAFVFDVDDTGPGISDPFAGYSLPGEDAEGGRGLALARRLADVVQVRTTGTGTLVRAYFWLG